MPTIVAICPYCREGGVRAPETSIGASATCPKCKSSFTVMPSDGLPGWAKPPEPASPAARKEAAPPASSPLEETRAASAMPDVTEPSPVLPAEAPPKSDPAPASAPASSFVPAAALDMGLVFALIALILVGVSVLASQLPFGRFIALGLVAVGFGIGLMCLGAEGRARLLGGLAMGLHLIVLALVLFLPGWLGLDPWVDPAGAEESRGVLAVPHDGGPPQPADWVDGATAAWLLGDTRVSVHGAFVGPVELIGPKGAKRRTKESYLQLTIRVTNVGTDRRIGLSGWASGGSPEGVRLSDPTGKEVKPKLFPAEWAPEREQTIPTGLFPGKSTDVLFVFELPPPKGGTMQLELSGAAVESAQPIRFRMPASFLGVRQ